jgi:hypothetical protein
LTFPTPSLRSLAIFKTVVLKPVSNLSAILAFLGTISVGLLSGLCLPISSYTL